MKSKLKSNDWYNDELETLWSPGPVKGVTLFKAKFHGDEQPRHSHDWYFVGMMEKGARTISTPHRTFTAEPGRLITLNPLEVHSCRAVGRRTSNYRAVYLDPAFVRRAIGVDPESECLVSFKQPLSEDSGLAGHMIDLLAGLEREPHSPDSLAEQLMQALYSIFSNYGSRGDHNRQDKSGAVARSLEYMRDKAHHDLTVDELAEHEGLSKYHFIRVFKAATGLSPHAYLVQRRLEISKQAIEQGVSLADAAAEAGFADQSHMTRWFKMVYCVTPGVYQRSLAG